MIAVRALSSLSVVRKLHTFSCRQRIALGRSKFASSLDAQCPQAPALPLPGGSHDIQIEDPFSHSASTVFAQSDMGSRVYLQGIYESFGELEAGLRIWNISVYVHRGTAR